ncbi:ThuA domain-containing protein [Lignipirellula cremea]|uniref:Trehalose utilization n=1 Tax=Lignipirellula cremea TaxID=2528010 RepID=A0A518E3K5_9BACT|nr:ThuA domain-containing protein [Lignipirellula cremea]QDU98667.1 Trehalose utilization [Lignipirellula cremea]
MKSLSVMAGCAVCLLLGSGPLVADPGVVYEGGEGPGKGKHVVLIAGDEEYRSEEGLPMLAKILSQRHGFQCTVLFSVDPETGEIDPNNQTNIPGMAALDNADMVILGLRFRELPDADMKHLVDYIHAGKPIMGLRTSTHSFNYSRNKTSPYAKYSFQNRDWPGGFGQQVLGETWINHHGQHGKESTRGVINTKQIKHPILTGVDDIWGPTDVYGVKNLPDDAVVLVRGQVLSGMEPTDKPVEGKKNDPLMPLVWTKTWQGESGKPCRVICTTMGAAVDLESAGLRRLLVNAVYWGVGLEDQISADSSVDYVGEYDPSFFGFNKAKKGVKPADHQLK